MTTEPVALGCVLPDVMLDLDPELEQPERPAVPWYAFSLWQPWATLWVAGDKWCETRTTATRYRGPVAVHATVTGMPLREYLVACQTPPLGSALVRAGIRPPVRDRSGRRGLRGPLVGQLPLGALVGVVEVVDCVPAERIVHDDVAEPERIDTEHGAGWVVPHHDSDLGDFGPGRYAWVTTNRQPLEQPIPCTGSQARPWRIPDEAHDELARQLAVA